MKNLSFSLTFLISCYPHANMLALRKPCRHIYSNKTEMSQRFLDCRHHPFGRMRSWMFQFLHSIRGIIHRQAQTALHFRNIRRVNLKTVMLLNVLLNHLIRYFFFRLTSFCPFFYFFQRDLPLSFAELNSHVDMTVRIFGKENQCLYFISP